MTLYDIVTESCIKNSQEARCGSNLYFVLRPLICIPSCCTQRALLAAFSGHHHIEAHKVEPALKLKLCCSDCHAGRDQQDHVISLSGLTQLQSLNLSRNLFASPLPKYLSLPNLTVLNLTANEFSGSLPDGEYTLVVRLDFLVSWALQKLQLPQLCTP